MVQPHVTFGNPPHAAALEDERSGWLLAGLWFLKNESGKPGWPWGTTVVGRVPAPLSFHLAGGQRRASGAGSNPCHPAPVGAAQGPPVGAAPGNRRTGSEEHGHRQIPRSAGGSARNDMNHLVLRSPSAPRRVHPSAPRRVTAARGLAAHGHRQIPRSAGGSARNDMNHLVLRSPSAPRRVHPSAPRRVTAARDLRSMGTARFLAPPAAPLGMTWGGAGPPWRWPTVALAHRGAGPPWRWPTVALAHRGADPPWRGWSLRRWATVSPWHPAPFGDAPLRFAPQNQMIHVIPNGAAGAVRNLAVPHGGFSAVRCQIPRSAALRSSEPDDSCHSERSRRRSEESGGAHAPQDPALRVPCPSTSSGAAEPKGSGCHGLLPAPLARRRAIRYAE